MLRKPWVFASALMSCALLWSSPPAQAQFIQQGPKLVGTGAVGSAEQGYAVAVSADGNTAIVGGAYDDTNGAAWVFTRSGGVWTQQGSKLVGTGASGDAFQGWSVALSADGNTAIVGGPQDNRVGDYGSIGAAWLFTRSGGVWTQQGGKLVGTGIVGYYGIASQGTSVALSADGNTAIVGGPADNTSIGAAWVYTRSGSVWTQQKLVGSGAVGTNVGQGTSVALSADGNTAIVGGPVDNDTFGAVWVFTRSGGVWTQQGAKLVGTGNAFNASQGNSVALSADGNTAIVGGHNDNISMGAVWIFTRSGGVWTQQGSKLVGACSLGGPGQGDRVALSGDGNTAIESGFSDNSNAGAVWVFTRSGGVWTQHGAKLVGTGAVGAADQGYSVALSADGNTAIMGGSQDNGQTGATWVFTRSGVALTTATHDFNGDCTSDILWRDSSGDIAMWLIDSGGILASAGLGTISTAWSIVGQRDFNGDGMADWLWRDTSGDLAIWFMNGTTVTSGVGLGTVNPVWSVVGTGDFNGDGYGDILWRDSSGDIAMWLMNGSTVLSSAGLGAISTTWSIVGTGDFNGDGKTDILWRDTSGNIAIWFMNGTTVSSGVGLGTIAPPWTIVGTGDFNGDGKSDILWRNTSTGDIAIWLMNGSTILSSAGLGAIDTIWSIAETGDFDGDGKSDILWHDSGGRVAIWFMNGTTVSSGVGRGTIPPSWSIQGAGAD